MSREPRAKNGSRRDVALTFSKDLDYVPVDIFAIDAYVTLQFLNSAEWQELDTLG